MMHRLTLLLVIACCIASWQVFCQDCTNDMDLEVSATGEGVIPAGEELVDEDEIFDSRRRRRESEPRAATFRNQYDFPLTLFWVSDEGVHSPIAEIDEYSDARIDTYNHHAFVAKARDGDASVPILPRAIRVVPTQNVYTFAPPKHSNAVGQTEKPFIRSLKKKSQSAAAKFKSYVPYKIDMYYEDGKGGADQGTLDLGQDNTVNSYIGHTFFFTPHGQKDKVLARHTVSDKQILYLIMDPEHPAPQNMLDDLAREQQFMADYEKRTGIPWRHYFDGHKPRGPPTLHMWPAEHVGQVHHIDSTEGFWKCRGERSDCQSSEPVHLNMTVISVKPKAFSINNFLSDAEVEEIISLAAPRMDISYIGNKEGGGARRSETRTSENAWLPRDSSPVLETLFKRAEHLLKIPRLDRRNTEDLQVVHYGLTQRYDAHYDWGVSGRAESRYITLLLYLTDMLHDGAGGETSFPKGGEDGLGIKVFGGKGNAIMFYNLLEDGNGDDLSLHASMPVNQGEKWLANFWVWDPHRN